MRKAISMDEPHDKSPAPLDYSREAQPVVPRYRRVLVAFLLFAGAAALTAGLFVSGDGAKSDMFVVGFGLVVFAAAIRSQR